MPQKQYIPSNPVEDTYYSLTDFVVSGVATSFEVLVRRDFGQRYFTFPKFVIGLIILLVFTLISSAPLDFSFIYRSVGLKNLFYVELPNFSVYFFASISLTYFFLGLTELRQHFTKEREGELWHSYFTGFSRFRFIEDISEFMNLKQVFGQHIIANHVVQIYLEPLFFLSLGLVFIIFFPIFGLWCMLGSMALFLHGQILFARLKNEMLDQQDSRIESKFMRASLSGNNPNSTAGLSPLALRPLGKRVHIETQQAIQNAFEDNPELARMAGKNPENLRRINRRVIKKS